MSRINTTERTARSERRQLPSGRCALAALLAALLIMTLPMVAGATAMTKSGILRFDGVARSLDDDSLLYRESHWQYLHDGEQRHLVLFRCPGGEPFARKLLASDSDGVAPDFDFFDARDGYEEGVLRRAGERFSYVRANQTAQRELRRIDPPQQAVIDAGFDVFVRQNWDDLLQGEQLPLQFLVPSRGEFLEFRFSRARLREQAGQQLLELRLGLDAWYGFAAPSIDLRYDANQQRLVQFRGLGTIRDQRGRQQKVQVDFAADALERAASADQLAAALEQPLVSSCPG